MLRREGLEGTDVFPFPSVRPHPTLALCVVSFGDAVGGRTFAFRKLSLSPLMSRSSCFLMPLLCSLLELPRSFCCVVDAEKHQNSRPLASPLTQIILAFHRQRGAGDN